jgi:glycosyltransferase involved in cell wall biosynthesis
MKLSCILPAHKEPYLQKTLDSFLGTSELGEQVEAIVVWDGTEFEESVKDDTRVKIVRLDKNLGMRAAINAGIEAAQGEFIMKLDAHCIVGLGFDRIMVENCAENWVLTPRKYSLNDELWERDLVYRPFKDSYYLEFPVLGRNGYGLAPATCRQWRRHIGNGDILDTMGFEGSCWIANKNYFMNCVGYLDDRPTTYGKFHSESMEIGLNYWLGGGEVKVITTTWYAHLKKMPRHYSAGLFNRIGKESIPYTWAAKHWMNDEHGKPKPFSWYIDKFWPIPGWPDNWKAVWEKNLMEFENG